MPFHHEAGCVIDGSQRYVAPLALFVAALSACETANLGSELQQQWLGKPMAQVIGATRAPERFIPLANGEAVYVWARSEGSTKSDLDCSKGLNGSVSCTSSASKIVGCEVTAIANREGIVTQIDARNCGTNFVVLGGNRYLKW
jgi:hypothetical protein